MSALLRCPTVARRAREEIQRERRVGVAVERALNVHTTGRAIRGSQHRKVLQVFAPESPSPASFGVTPAGARSISQSAVRKNCIRLDRVPGARLDHHAGSEVEGDDVALTSRAADSILLAEFRIRMPSVLLGSGVVPSARVPILFPCTRLPVA